MASIDWNQVKDEVTGFLQDLVRFDTTNPPGNESAAVDFLARILDAEGIRAILEAQHEIIDIAHQVGVTAQLGSDHTLEPKVEHVASHAEGFHLRVLLEPDVTLARHPAPDAPGSHRPGHLG